MNVLIVNASPRKDANSMLAVKEMTRVFDRENVEYEIMRIGNSDIRGCIACGTCGSRGKCVFDDAVNEAAEKFEKADGFVIASPVYYASPNGTAISFMDRLFYSTSFDKSMKVGAAVAVARRSGTTASFDVLNKYFTISGMPVASSMYWNNLYGTAEGEAAEDTEGLQRIRILAENMVFLMKSIKLGKEEYGLPEKEDLVFTNFIR